MIPHNPFGDDATAADASDVELVDRIRRGSREALEELVTRRQEWIDNIALRMVYG